MIGAMWGSPDLGKDEILRQMYVSETKMVNQHQAKGYVWDEEAEEWGLGHEGFERIEGQAEKHLERWESLRKLSLGGI